MLQHIGISINNQNDIENFYKKLLGFEESRSFILNSNLAERIFGINEDTPVITLNKEELYLELFLTDEKINPVFSHICISVDKKDDLVEKADFLGYQTEIIKKDLNNKLAFIKDTTGNSFEIKDN